MLRIVGEERIQEGKGPCNKSRAGKKVKEVRKKRRKRETEKMVIHIIESEL